MPPCNARRVGRGPARIMDHPRHGRNQVIGSLVLYVIMIVWLIIMCRPLLFFADSELYHPAWPSMSGDPEWPE
jgi:hypothetical protein